MKETDLISDGKSKYTVFLVAFKWLTGVIEFGGGVYILMQYYEFLGIAYGIYVAIAGALIMPLSSCVNCYYFGQRCHCGWGYVSSLLHKMGDKKLFIQTFPWRILLHPVWIVPLVGALVSLARMRNSESAIISVAYIVVIFIHHRLLMKHLACKVCHQRFNCPGCQYRDYLAT
ncbi:MAG: hypothetical protein CO189_11735 [candidate division Zixibacteria bacterium CG_4_9_14_3_um_filter_46_8]|nr:MAG: hypothetical protein CO189_11735 [candidate division Zixibacteria bacterium CG_4_9_14_3_um_filter_46_8]